MMKRLVIMTIFLICILTTVSDPADVYAVSTTPFTDKKVLIEGDSNQFGHGRYVEQTVLSMGTNIDLINNASPGSTFAYNPKGSAGKKSVWYRISRMPKSELSGYDYIIISAGSNDWHNGKKIGFGKKNSKKLKTIQGGVNRTIRYIRKYNKRAKIVLVTPIYRYRIKKGPPAKFGDCEKIKNKTAGKTLADYRKAITDAAKKYSKVYIVQGTSIATKAESRNRRYLKDGLHTSNDYAKLLSKRLRTRFIKLGL